MWIYQLSSISIKFYQWEGRVFQRLIWVFFILHRKKQTFRQNIASIAWERTESHQLFQRKAKAHTGFKLNQGLPGTWPRPTETGVGMLDYQYFNVWIDEGKHPVVHSCKLQAQDRGIFLAVSIWLNTKKPADHPIRVVYIRPELPPPPTVDIRFMEKISTALGLL